MKSPLKSKRFWGGVWIAANTVWALLPPAWKQPFIDAYNYVNVNLPPEQLSILGCAYLTLYGGMVADERLDWRKLIPWRRK